MTLTVTYKPKPIAQARGDGQITNLRIPVGRNTLCPFCTSGKKFKACHGAPRAEGIPHGRRFAGHAHETPGFFLYTAVHAVGPIPAVINRAPSDR